MTALGVLTLFVALLGCAWTWSVRPPVAVSVYLAIVLFYPEGVTIRPIGTIDLDPGRIIVFAVFANLLFKSGIPKDLRPNLMDATIALMFIGQLISSFQHMTIRDTIESEGNVFIRMGMAYIVVRMSIRSHDDLRLLIKTIIRVAIPLAFIAIYECLTDINLFEVVVRQLAGHNIRRSTIPPRYDFYRAVGSFMNPIVFGLFFAGVAPLALSLPRSKRLSRLRIMLFIMLMGFAVLSTVSSAPLFSLVTSMAIIMLYPFRQILLIASVFLIAAAVLWQVSAETLGIPPLEDIGSRMAFVQRNAVYRVNLIREAFGGGMDGHWLYGYGPVGMWNPLTPSSFTWEHDDFANMYVGKLVRYGLVAAIPWLLVHLTCILKLFQAARVASNPADTWTVMCYIALMIGWQVALMTVSLLVQFITFYFVVLALMANLPDILASQDTETTPEPLASGEMASP